MKEEKVWFKNKQGEKLAGILHIPDGEGAFPAVVLCHGITGDKDEWNKIEWANTLAENGFLALRFDFTGHGKSEGKFEEATVTQEVNDLENALDFVEKLKNVDKNKIGVIGHSYGALVSLVAATKDKRIKTFCMLATAGGGLVGEELLTWLAKFGDIKNIVKDYARYPTAKFAKKVKIPLLLIHNKNEIFVSVRNSIEIAKVSKYARLELTPGKSHSFAGKKIREKVNNLIVKWFKKHLK